MCVIWYSNLLPEVFIENLKPPPLPTVRDHLEVHFCNNKKTTSRERSLSKNNMRKVTNTAILIMSPSAKFTKMLAPQVRVLCIKINFISNLEIN